MLRCAQHNNITIYQNPYFYDVTGPEFFQRHSDVSKTLMYKLSRKTYSLFLQNIPAQILIFDQAGQTFPDIGVSDRDLLFL
jgi:hypothetical protein